MYCEGLEWKVQRESKEEERKDSMVSEASSLYCKIVLGKVLFCFKLFFLQKQLGIDRFLRIY